MTVSSQSQSFETVIDGIHFGECLRWRDGLLYFVDMYADVVRRPCGSMSAAGSNASR